MLSKPLNDLGARNQRAKFKVTIERIICEIGAGEHGLIIDHSQLGVELSGIAQSILRFQKTLSTFDLLIIDELGFVPLAKTGAELLFEVFSRRYERSATLVTSNLPFNEWTEAFGSERLTGALLDRLTHHVHILEMNGESYRLKDSKQKRTGKERS